MTYVVDYPGECGLEREKLVVVRETLGSRALADRQNPLLLFVRKVSAAPANREYLKTYSRVQDTSTFRSGVDFGQRRPEMSISVNATEETCAMSDQNICHSE